MEVSLIVAMDAGRWIGVDGKLPWHLPADLRHFKALTVGKPIVMGRKTHDSIGRALPGRENIVITRDPHYSSPGCVIMHSLHAVLQRYSEADEVMVIGGAEIYSCALALANRLYVTIVHTEVRGDVRFPFSLERQWRVAARTDHKADAENAHDYSFVIFEPVG